MLSIGRLEKIIQSLLAGIFLVFAVVSFAQAEELTQQEREYLRQKGAIVFISQTHYPPFEFLGEDGDHTGMSIELARWIATRFGFKTRFVNASFKDAQETVLSGNADVITSLFYSKKRDQVFDFTQIMFSVPASIFVKSDRPDIKRIEDLNGKTIAMQAGDYAYEFLESRRIKFKVVWTSNFAQATDMVIAGKADAVIGDEQIVLYHIYSNHLTDLIKKVGMPLYVGENCMGVKHGNHVLQSILNKGISLAKETGTLDRINTTWLGIQYKVGKPFVVRNLNYFLTSAGLLIALALLAWLWNIRLRILVNKRAEALSHSEATLRAILANSPLGIGLVKNQVMVWHNQALGKMLGSGLKELDGQNLAKFFPNAVAFGRTAATIGNSLNETGEAVVETKCVRMDGTALDCVVHCAFLGDGEDGDAIIVMAQDISEQKQAQTKLIESEERYRLLAEHASDVIWSIDKDFKVTYVSPSVGKLRGFTPAEVVGQPLENTLSPKSMQLVHEVIKKITAQIAGGDHDIPSFTLELEQPRKDGSTVWTEVVVDVVFDAQSNYSHLQGVSRDITLRRELEAKIREAQKIEYLGTLSAGIAHEFNNIMAVIMGYAELALGDIADPTALNSQLNEIINAAMRARNLVRQILIFSRQIEIEKEPIDLGEELLRTIEFIKHTLPGMIEVEVNLAPDLYKINGSENLIKQIMSNLASNARDAMPLGGKLILEASNINLDEDFCKTRPGLSPGLHVVLRVTDTGQGMDQHTLRQIYDPFFTTKEIGKGTGLGLATVHGIVKSHGGYISCQSQPGQGTKFEVFLPALADKSR